MFENIPNWNKIKSKVMRVNQKLQQEIRIISSATPACVTEGWMLQTPMQNWTKVVKKICQHPLWGEYCEAGVYGRIAFKGRKNNVKRPQWAKAHKDWTREQWNKFLWTVELKIEIFDSTRRVHVKSWWKSCNSLYHTNRKALYGVGGFSQ